MKQKLIPLVEETFAQPKRELHVFNDVFPDYEAEQTTRYLSDALHIPFFPVPIRHPHDGAYLTETITSLDRSKCFVPSFEHAGHADYRATQAHRESGTLTIVNNKAPRSKATTNGREFLCAVTDLGQEVYGVPAESLTDIREQVVALFVVPNTYFRPHCQFRSAEIAGVVRKDPSRLQPFYQYGSRLELLEALKRRVRSPIPAQHHPVELRYKDRFENLRFRAKHFARTREQLEAAAKRNADHLVGVRVGTCRDTLRAFFVNGGLTSVPDGALGIYVNPSDDDLRRDTRSGFLELNVKWVDGTPGIVPTSYDLLGKPEPGTPLHIVPLP